MKTLLTHSVLTRLRAVVLAAIALIAGLTARADVNIDATNFPDPYLRHYIQHVMYLDNAVAIAAAKGSTIPADQYDENGNPFSNATSLTDAEIALITEINLNRAHTNIDATVPNVSDLTGIKNFTSLQRLFCDNHDLTTLDVSGLTNLRVLSAHSNNISSINVNNCTLLNSVTIYRNNLKTPEIVNNLVYGLPDYGEDANPSTLTLYYYSYYQNYYDESGDGSYYNVEENYYSHPDSTENNRWIRSEMVGVLAKKGWQVKECKYLDYPNGYYYWDEESNEWKNGGPKEGDYSETIMESSDLGDLVMIDEENFPDENFLYYIKNLMYLDNQLFTNNTRAGIVPNLAYLRNEYDVAEVNIGTEEEPVIRYNPFHNARYLTDNALNCIREIYLNRITDPDGVIRDPTGINKFTYLEKLFCDGIQLQTLNVSGLKNLQTLDAHDNSLTSLDASGLNNLKTLDAHDNNLTSLNISGCNNLKNVSIHNNNLTSLNITGCDNLRNVSIYNNSLSREYLTDSIILKMPRYKEVTSMRYPNDPQLRCQLHLYDFDNEPDNAEIYQDAVNWLTRFRTWSVTKGSDDTQLTEYIGLPDVDYIPIDAEHFPDPNFLKYLKTHLTIHPDNKEWFPYNNPGWDLKLTPLEILEIKAIAPIPGSEKVASLEGVKYFTYLEKINIEKTDGPNGVDGSKSHEITTLDVSGMKNLKIILARGNLLTSVNIEGCDSLRHLCVVDNCLGELAMKKLIGDLPDRRGKTPGIFRVKYNTYGVWTVDYRTSFNPNYYSNQNILTAEQAGFADYKNWPAKAWAITWNNPRWLVDGVHHSMFDEPYPPIEISGYTVEDENLLKYISERAYIDNKATINAAYAAAKYFKRGKENPYWFPLENKYNDEGKLVVKARDENGKLIGIRLYEDDVEYLRYLNLDNYSDPKKNGGNYRPIADLTGVKLFTSLEQLHAPYHHLTNVDVSGMPKLRILRLHSQAEGHKLQSLNVANCDSLWQIYADDNELTSTGVDFTNTPNLRMLRINNNPQIGLQEVEDPENPGTYIRPGIDLSQNTKLQHLDIYNCHLKELDVTNNPDLEVLYCYETRDNESLDNGGDGSIDGTGTTRRGEITTLNLTNNTKLKELRCSNNPLSDLDLSHNSLLEILYVNSIDMMTQSGMSGNTNMLQKNLQYTPALKQLSCYNANLDALDVSQNANLWELICYKNNIKYLNLSANTALTYLSTGEAQEGPDLRNANNPNGGNPIRRLDVSALTNLKTLHCAKMQLTDLDLSSNAALKDLDYQIQERTIQAEVADHRQIENGEVVHYNMYYLRMDSAYSDNGLLLSDRIAASDYDGTKDSGVPSTYEPSSNFDISLLMENYSGSLTNGELKTGTREGDGTVPTSGPRRTPADPDKVNTDAIIGTVLVLTNVTETSEQATGTVNYQYDISLNENVDPAINKETPFTLNWYAILENGDPVITGVDDLTTAGEVESVTYVNPAGQVATTPWTGINLVITRYTNGTSTTEKRLF